MRLRREHARVGAHKSDRLLKLPSDAGSVPVSKLLFSHLQARSAGSGMR